jgi:hypothetical protein
MFLYLFEGPGKPRHLRTGQKTELHGELGRYRAERLLTFLPSIPTCNKNNLKTITSQYLSVVPVIRTTLEFVDRQRNSLSENPGGSLG